ncbi:trypsin-like peptidase domain-containing protein [Lentzea sp. BCCO 10_0061]|uniref:Serine protease n=1 Tax=Lentzea sokolovensis TaxID=3095429 RepID=A0ABU4VAF9_9PSEU|nr:trypsin-like peptidase domain-containing protein [Lentzea sp. BCCO 10_0061]MDX8148793.1 trypsin-like peptidase domain-containing protein [Lentzea sp. BCCO 10_0061]
MVSVLDAFPYPFHDPAGQQLHRTLMSLYPAVKSAVLMAERAGLDTGFLDEQQAVAFVWKNILQMTATQGLTRPLVTDVLGTLSPTSPARPFLAGLLADRPTPISSERVGSNGEPPFDDSVTEPEALLYQDDLTMPIGRVPALIESLRTLVELAPSVCLLNVTAGNVEQYGTGFRIGPDLLLTNWHVLHRRNDGARATVVTAEFGFEDDGVGGVCATTAVKCDVNGIESDQGDDWAVIRTTGTLADRWPVVPLSSAATPRCGEPAFVVQHPRGQRKRLGFVRNQVTYCDDRLVHYLTDTQVGSSGAPVFDASGRLIALHHAGGRPQEVLGKPPMRKNEGVRISCITDGLARRGVAVP